MKLREVFTNIVKKSGLAAASVVVAMSTLTAGVITMTQPGGVDATCTPQDSYPLTNVIYCGLSGTAASDLLASFQSYYNSGHDTNNNKDLQAVYNAVGFKTAMFTSGHWAVGTSYNNGTIVVDGKVVGTNVQIASRCYLPNMGNCQPPSKYKHLVGNVYTRDATWFFDKDVTSKVTLVHINDTTGGADFALWKGCGNALLFTSKPQPKVLVCVDLTATKTNEHDEFVDYAFTAQASRQYTKITHYDFNFGDSHTQRVDVNDVTSTSAAHTYDKTDLEQKVTAKVTVSDDTSTASSSSCEVDIIIHAKPKPKSLVCTGLTAEAKDSAKTKYVFTATATAKNTTIDSYTFTFGDGTSENVSTSAASAKSSTHTYKPGTYKIQASVTGPLGTFAGSACAVKITVKTPPPHKLVNTGPGSAFALVGATTVIGAALHQLTLRKKFQN